MALNPFSNIGGTASGFLNIGIVLLIILFACGVIIGLFFFIRRMARFQGFKVVIWEVLESGGIRVNYDKAGIFVMGKTGNKLLYLKRSNVGLNPDNISYVIDSKGKKVIYLMRYGFKNFVFINPMADKKGNFNFKVGEEDVNWAINSYEANKKRFSQSLLAQMLPFAVMALVCVIILIMMIVLFKNFSVFTQVADSINQASQSLATCTISSGGVI